MNPRCRTSTLNHYLVAQAEACGTGANAHELHALVGNYYELCLLADQDGSLMGRVETLERRLRAFCQGAQAQTAAACWTN